VQLQRIRVDVSEQGTVHGDAGRNVSGLQVDRNQPAAGMTGQRLGSQSTCQLNVLTETERVRNSRGAAGLRRAIRRLRLFLVHREAVRVDDAGEDEEPVSPLGTPHDLRLRQHIEGLPGFLKAALDPVETHTVATT
jgi:hypothetical protein